MRENADNVVTVHVDAREGLHVPKKKWAEVVAEGREGEFPCIEEGLVVFEQAQTKLLTLDPVALLKAHPGATVIDVAHEGKVFLHVNVGSVGQQTRQTRHAKALDWSVQCLKEVMNEIMTDKKEAEKGPSIFLLRNTLVFNESAALHSCIRPGCSLSLGCSSIPPRQATPRTVCTSTMACAAATSRSPTSRTGR